LQLLEGKEKVMRIRDTFVSIVTLVLAVITVTGMAYTDQFPQAATAESVGFDALAHQVFSASKTEEVAQVVSQ
jgi:hypothetical protein